MSKRSERPVRYLRRIQVTAVGNGNDNWKIAPDIFDIPVLPEV
jgi:hypothetical protein